MSYTITNYTRRQAKRLGVTVKPSTRKGKKIDVFKDDPELYEFYKKMFHLKKGELQNDK